MEYQSSLAFAKAQDQKDPLNSYREQFYLPKNKDGSNMIYFTGNSLGLQPKTTRAYIEQEMLDWQNLGVEGHFHGKNPWFYYHHFMENASAKLVGANPSEVVIMNGLTVNLHLMMISFYRPTKNRYKILIESTAFPSDKYAVASQASIHGFAPEDAVVEIKPRDGEETLRTEDILQKIKDLGDELALVMLGGVNYYTGQYFELEKITSVAHQVGAKCGFDLAHGVGNIPFKLHDWKVDFAVWCTYKYLNSGPGSVSGTFVHEKHGDNKEIVRLAGWWGNDEKTRFLMEDKFVPQSGAAGWQLSNAPVLSMASYRASLEIFENAGIENLRKKSIKLTGYLEHLVGDLNSKKIMKPLNIITPKDPEQRGCQLSILTGDDGKALFDRLTKNDVIADWREPNVIRIAPVPLYNTFEECWQFVNILASFE